MITPELIGYIRGEFAKGRTREEIRAGLVAAGGWNEDDLNEAFRIVIPMQQSTSMSSTAATVNIKSKSKIGSIISILLVLVCLVAVYFYRSQIVSLWSSATSNLSMPSFGLDKITGIWSGNEPQAKNNTVVPPPINIARQNVATIKYCGNTTAPDLKFPLSYSKNPILDCLANSALLCENAQANLKDDIFPEVFQVVKEKSTTENTCSFRLSYQKSSTLVDATGQKLALQYITCPLSIVKSVNEGTKTTSFSAPNTTNLGKYAAQVYFYGTLGVFLENGLDQNKIRAMGCSGDYINSVIASYQKTQTKK